MQHNAPVTVVFVSGGLGSGKSTFTKLCAKHGATTLNADEIVSRLYEDDHQMVQEIEKVLGSEIKNIDGSVNKQQIAAKIYSDSELREKVENIIHPRVQASLKVKISGDGIFVYEIPVLNSKTNLSFADYVVIVQADEKRRIERAVARGMRREDALSRIEVQKKNDFIPSGAVLVSNNGSLADLEEYVESFLARVSND